jgi:hypothetical protein
MKARKLFSALVLLTAAMPLANAAEPVTTTPKTEPAMAMPEHHTDTLSMMDRAQKAKTPAERNKLMAENMAIMKTHMAEMKKIGAMVGMMDGKMMDGKPMPMAMDPAHMEKMHQHMAMMHEMMERLMIQQELMMKASAK